MEMNSQDKKMDRVCSPNLSTSARRPGRTIVGPGICAAMGLVGLRGAGPAAAAGPVAMATATAVAASTGEPAADSAPLSAAEHRAIIQRFVAEAPRFFGDNLVVGFVCGSVAGGFARTDHDIDTFVIVERDDPEQRRIYEQWLAELHRAVGLKVDEAYPSEVLSRQTLADTLARLPSVELSLDFNSSATFDAVVWADMLVASTAGVIGDAQELETAAGRARPHVERWRQQVLADVRAHGDEAAKVLDYRAERQGRQPPEDLASLSFGRLAKRVVSTPEEAPPEDTSPLAEAMMNQPRLFSRRLLLRPLEDGDAPDVAAVSRLLPRQGRPALLPPPLPDAEAQAWVQRQKLAASRGESVVWAVCDRVDGSFLGFAGLATGLEASPAEVVAVVVSEAGAPTLGPPAGIEAEARARLRRLAAGPLQMSLVPEPAAEAPRP